MLNPRPATTVRVLFTALLVGVLGLCSAGSGQPPGAAARKPGNPVYRKVAPSTVAFAGPRGAAIGSGVLIDADRRLVLTAHHVVNAVADGRLRVGVFFPRRDGARVVTDAYEYAKAYRKDPDSLIIGGKIVAFDPVKDLALVQLDRVPDGIKAIPLAADEPEPGETIHVIGNSTGGRGGVFGYNRGYVRNAFLHGKGAYCFFALCHQSPTNRGDSGGPVVNDDGELVAIISHGTTGSGDVEQVVDYSVHLRELRAFVAGKTTTKEPCQLPSGESFTLRATASKEGQSDALIFRVKKGERFTVEMRGNKATDLDLFLDPGLDAARHRKVARTGDTDQETVDFKADWTGLCRIKVVNFHAAELRARAAADTKPLPETTRPNAYTLEVRFASPHGGPVTVLREIGAAETDTVRLPYRAGKKAARVTIVGQGHEDLDLIVLDPDDKEVTRADTYESRETVSWVPAREGVYTIRVRNLDEKHGSRYCLMTD